jgi:hypothetical protein
LSRRMSLNWPLSLAISYMRCSSTECARHQLRDD